MGPSEEKGVTAEPQSQMHFYRSRFIATDLSLRAQWTTGEQPHYFHFFIIFNDALSAKLVMNITLQIGSTLCV